MAMTPKKLKAFRAEYGLTQEQLATHLGITRAAVNMMEMGVRGITSITELALETIRRRIETDPKTTPKKT